MKNLMLFLCSMIIVGLCDSRAQGSLVLVGGSGETAGGWSDAPYKWVVDHTENKRVAVISYGTESQWIPNYFKSLGARHAKNFYIPNRAVADQQTIYDSLLTYDAVFLKGGDQSVYYESYLNTKTQEAMQAIYNRGGVLSGTSAGMAVLSPIIYTAQGAYIYPATAISNPYSNQITLRNDFLQTLPTPVIFDTHFVQRGRLGRLIAFMAHWFRSTGILPVGIGVDDRTALCIDSLGVATVYGTAAANFVFPEQDAPVFDTSVMVLKAETLRLTQLLHGTSINLTTKEVTGYSQSFNPQADVENKKLSMLLTGAEQLDNAAISHFVQQEGSLSDTITIVTGNDLSLANSLASKVISQGGTHVNVIQALQSFSQDAATGQAIASAKKIVIIGNEYNSFFSFMNGEGNGKLLGQQFIKEGVVLLFAGDNARFAGKTVVGKYMGFGYTSYNGTMTFSTGLGLLQTTAIMPHTFLNEEVYENTISGLPYALLKDTLSFGIYLTGNAVVRYGVDAENNTCFQYLSGSVPAIILNNKGTLGGFANQGPNLLSRNVAGFETVLLSTLVQGDSYIVGSYTGLSHRVQEPINVKILPNPAADEIVINTEQGSYELALLDTSGRQLLTKTFNSSTNLDLSQFAEGVYFITIENPQTSAKYMGKVLKINNK